MSLAAKAQKKEEHKNEIPVLRVLFRVRWSDRGDRGSDRCRDR